VRPGPRRSYLPCHCVCGPLRPCGAPVCSQIILDSRLLGATLSQAPRCLETQGSCDSTARC